MSNTTLQKEVLLEKLNNTNLMLVEVLKNYQEADLFDEKQYQTLSDALAKNQEYQRRLEKEDFEIAIIGAEKAGKSTFANALIKSTFLPSATERCTFTSTTIEYGENEEAVIELYSEEEFNTIFKKLLTSINYPTDKIPENFRTFTLEEFEKESSLLEESNDINYLSAHEDIIAILNNKERFSLTGETIKLNKKENKDFDLIVNQYITGEVLENGLKSTAKPRSAKSIKIKTQNLSELKNAVIYDVPGFDSPVSEHKAQAKFYLDKADVVIFVTDMNRPSFTNTVYEILSYKGKNDIMLKDKLFIFGNRKDKANSLEEAENNNKELQKEVENFHLNSDNLVTGSALRSLKEYGLYNEEISGLDIEGNMDAFREKIVEFNRTKRLESIAARFNQNNQVIKTLLKTVVSQNQNLLSASNDDELKYKLNKEIESLIKDTLTKVNKEIKKEFNENKTLTEEFSQSIEDNTILQKIDLNYVESLSDVKSVTYESQFSLTNFKAREQKFYSILQNFSDTLQELSKSKTRLVKDKILNALLTQLQQENNSVDHNVLRTLLEEAITPFDIENSPHNQFEFLFDRYSRHVFDIFASPLGDSGRESKFNNAKADFLYLDHLYSLNTHKRNYTLINLLLTQKESELYEAILRKTEEFIKSIADNYTHHEMILKSAETLKTGLNWVKNKFGQKEEDTTEINHAMENSKEEIIENFFNESIFDINIHQYISSPKVANSLDGIVDEINKDMENIKKIFRDAVSPAMGLELVFLNSMDKKITESIQILTNVSSVNRITNVVIGDIDTFKEKQNVKLNKLNQIEKLTYFLEN